MSNKVTIIGAGSVGSTIAYTMVVNGVASEIVMIDINEEKALGEAMDIRQVCCIAPHRQSMPEVIRTQLVLISSY